MNRAAAKPIVKSIHRSHQFAAITCFWLIKVKLTLHDVVWHQVQQHNSRFGEIESGAVKLGDSRNGSLDKKPRVRCWSSQRDDYAF